MNVSNIGGSDFFEYNVKAVCKSYVNYVGHGTAKCLDKDAYFC